MLHPDRKTTRLVLQTINSPIKYFLYKYIRSAGSRLICLGTISSWN